MAPGPDPRSPTRLVAGIALVSVSALFLYNGLQLFALAIFGFDKWGETAMRLFASGFGPMSGPFVLWTGGFVTTVFSLAGIVGGVGVLRRREAGRQTGVFLTAAFAVVILPLSFAGLMSEPPAADADLGLLFGVVNLAILALLMAPGTVDDIDVFEQARRRRAAEASAHRRSIPPAAGPSPYARRPDGPREVVDQQRRT